MTRVQRVSGITPSAPVRTGPTVTFGQDWRPGFTARQGERITFAFPHEPVHAHLRQSHPRVNLYNAGIGAWTGRIGYSVDGGDARFLPFAERSQTPDGRAVFRYRAQVELPVPAGAGEIAFWIETEAGGPKQYLSNDGANYLVEVD